MNNNQNPVIITEEDFGLLKQYRNESAVAGEMSLSNELNRAIIVKEHAFPPGTVRINSKVSVLDLDSNKMFAFTLVMPAHADMSQHKVSILTPMGAALIGFRKGEEVQWKVPAGLKRFRIEEVIN